MERKIVFSEDEIYHAYNRGVEKRDIFLDDSDYERMTLLLYLCNSEMPVNIRDSLLHGLNYNDLWTLDTGKTIVDIGAWCLMPNHFHLLLREIKVGGISQFMLKITTAYTMYLNRKIERVGSLMQGPFKAEHVADDRYLQYLFSYIHLNPVKCIPGEREWSEKGIKDLKRAQAFLNQYQSSSLMDYRRLGSRPQSKIIVSETFPWKFESVSALNKELTGWLSLEKYEKYKG